MDHHAVDYVVVQVLYIQVVNGAAVIYLLDRYDFVLDDLPILPDRHYHCGAQVGGGLEGKLVSRR